MSFNTLIIFFVSLFSFLTIASAKPRAVAVSPSGETDQVHKSGDAADDPAIWLHATDPAKSIIFGANKLGSIHAYNLSGKELKRYDVGNINNIDVRYQVPAENGKTVDVLGGSDRTRSTLIFFSVNKDGALTPMTLKESVKISSPYGFCFYQNPSTMATYAISVPKTGLVQHYQLTVHSETQLSLKKVKEIKLSSQPEGCVGDDLYGSVFVGEENKGMWKWGGEPTDTTKPVLIDTTGSGGHLKADIEGIALYQQNGGAGYVVASSQGDNTFAVYDRKSPHKYRGSFTIVSNSKYDGVSNTDGLDILNFDFGPAYPAGLVVVQDGANVSEKGARERQNFKMVDWRSVATALNLE